MLPHEFSAGDVFSLVTPENLERLLRQTLEKSGFFGAKFRENAGRALLLPRADFKKTPAPLAEPAAVEEAAWTPS